MPVDDHGLEVLKKAGEDVGETPKSDYAIKTSLIGLTRTGTNKKVAVTDDGKLEIGANKTHFDEIKIAERSVIFELKSVYGISNLHNLVTKTGSGDVTNPDGEFLVSTTTSAGTSVLDSAERGRYMAGQDAQAGLGVRSSSVPTGNAYMAWGYYDDQNGFGFGRDASGIYVFRRKGGSDTKVYQQDWNVDKLDGTGASEFTLDISDGNVFQIDFSWYGYGSIEFKVNLFDEINREQIPTIMHRMRIEGENSIKNPNLPIRAEVNNGTSSGALSLYVGGRQFSTFGKYLPSRRITGERRIGQAVSTTVVPLVSFKRKSSFSSVSVKTEGFDVITDQNLIIEVRLGGTLTGASFTTPTNVTASETAIESDVSATAITGGDVIWSGLVSASGAGSNRTGSSQQVLIPVDYVNEKIVSLCARVVTSDGTVSSLFRAAEEW